MNNFCTILKIYNTSILTTQLRSTNFKINLKKYKIISPLNDLSTVWK